MTSPGRDSQPVAISIVDVQGNEAELDTNAWTSSSTSGTGTIEGIQASASFGFVGIDLIGSGSITGSVAAWLEKDDVPGARIYLSDLVADLGAAADFVDQPTFSGSGSFTLDVEMSPDFLSLLSTGTLQITINVNSIGDAFTITDFLSPTWVDSDSFSVTGDYTSTFKKALVVDIELGSPVVSAEILGSTYESGVTTVDFVGSVLSGGPIAKVFAPTPPDIIVDISDADLTDLVNFKDISFSDILDALSDLAAFLSSIEGLDFLDQKIPLINKSASELLSFADKFTTALDEITSDPAGTIQLIEAKLRNAFGLPAIPSPGDLFGIDLSLDGLTNELLKFELDLGISFNESIGVELPEFLDLGSLSIPGLSGSIDLGGSADLNANGSLTIDLDFSIDLGVSDPLKLGDIYIYDSPRA